MNAQTNSVLVEKADGVMKMTLNRADSQNSIIAEVYAQLITAAREAEADDQIRAILLQASGKNFCMGADAGNLTSYSERGLSETFEQDFFGQIGLDGGVGGPMNDYGIGAWALAFASIEKPIICAVQGVAAGGGFALAMLPHFRIAAGDTRFVSAFPKLGLGSELGLSATLPAACGMQNAMDIILSSRTVDGEEAFRLGIVDRLSKAEELDVAANEFALEIAALAPLAVRATLRQLRRGWLEKLRTQLEIEWRDQMALFASEDFNEGVRSFAERRPASFTGR